MPTVAITAVTAFQIAASGPSAFVGEAEESGVPSRSPRSTAPTTTTDHGGTNTMTTPRHETDPNPTGMHYDPGTGQERNGKHGGHGMMMMLTCVPVLLIAGLLVVTGVAGTGALVAALLCMAMMLMLPGGHSHK